MRETALLWLATAVLGTVSMAGTAAAGPGLAGKNIVGARLGPWLAGGLTEEFDNGNVQVSTSSTAFHLEFFYEYNLWDPSDNYMPGSMYLDLNFGAVSRGDIRIQNVSTNPPVSALGTASVYPLGIGLQWFPLSGESEQLIQPLVTAGGSVIIGTETLSYISNNLLGSYLGWSSESREALGWYAGAGVNWILGENFALSFLGKYQHAKFGSELVGQRDFSGMQILVGAAYLYH
jgi:hypothetical protein